MKHTGGSDVLAVIGTLLNSFCTIRCSTAALQWRLIASEITGFSIVSPVSVEFPAQKASNAENVSIWWRHNGCGWSLGEATVNRSRQTCGLCWVYCWENSVSNLTIVSTHSLQVGYGGYGYCTCDKFQLQMIKHRFGLNRCQIDSESFQSCSVWVFGCLVYWYRHSLIHTLI